MATLAVVCGVLDIFVAQLVVLHGEHRKASQQTNVLNDCLPSHRNVVELQGWNVAATTENGSICFGRTLDSTTCHLRCLASVQRPRCRFVAYNMDRGTCDGFTAAGVTGMTLERNASFTLLGSSGKKFDRKDRFRLQDQGHLLASGQGLHMYAAESCLALCHILPQCNVCTFNNYSGLCWLKSMPRPEQFVGLEASSWGVISFVS
ncbi:hypothetical protein BV898_12989 [Hypsibius exemplaris]|uniref:Apple domain-containing protein n=1 Tax=Hypsibius exemplaris TaxID=2072580 RepID=A0A1W0WC56_HYPEX|nr:hypothetical protein BV898_12989 [Hypsibius exemplaris]